MASSGTAFFGAHHAPAFPSASPLHTAGSSSSALSDPSSSPDADLDYDHPRASQAGPSRKRLRPKIDLAPGQPPTARGNPRIRVFVACYQW